MMKSPDLLLKIISPKMIHTRKPNIINLTTDINKKKIKF
jgi:hypothetical protein